MQVSPIFQFLLGFMFVVASQVAYSQSNAGLPPLVGGKVSEKVTNGSRSSDSNKASPNITPLVSSDNAQEVTRLDAKATESLMVLGQEIKFANPTGYCSLGKSSREEELISVARRLVRNDSQLLHLSVSCVELDSYRKGHRDSLDHWLQIQLLGNGGSFKRVEVPRESFLSSLSKAKPRVDSAELNRRVSTSLGSGDLSFSEMKFELIGRDGNAVYYLMQTKVSSEGNHRLISGLSAVTLLNSLPLAINIYESSGSAQSRNRLQISQRQLMTSLLIEN